MFLNRVGCFLLVQNVSQSAITRLASNPLDWKVGD